VRQREALSLGRVTGIGEFGRKLTVPLVGGYHSEWLDVSWDSGEEGCWGVVPPSPFAGILGVKTLDSVAYKRLVSAKY
jgi:hypothetical protein